MIFSVFLAGFTKEIETMALDQSALSDLLDALQSGGDLDFLREAVYTPSHQGGGPWVNARGRSGCWWPG